MRATLDFVANCENLVFRSALTLSIRVFRVAGLIAQSNAKKITAKPNGLKRNASSKLPSVIAAMDLVVPQAGQGMPVVSLIGQTMGPSVIPFVLIEISRIENQIMTKSVIRFNLKLSRGAVVTLHKTIPEFVPKRSVDRQN